MLLLRECIAIPGHQVLSGVRGEKAQVQGRGSQVSFAAAEIHCVGAQKFGQGYTKLSRLIEWLGLFMFGAIGQARDL